MVNRMSWDQYFTYIAMTASLRVDCYGSHYGAVIVNDHRVIAIGYNGTAHGKLNCTEGGCHRCKLRRESKIESGVGLDECACVHAEANTILHAQINGFKLFGETTMYVAGNGPYNQLCRLCINLVFNVGIPLVLLNGKVVHAIG